MFVSFSLPISTDICSGDEITSPFFILVIAYPHLLLSQVGIFIAFLAISFFCAVTCVHSFDNNTKIVCLKKITR